MSKYLHGFASILLGVALAGVGARAQEAPAGSGASAGWTPVRRIPADEKRIWLFPLRAARGRDWKPVLAVVGATAALVALDPHTAPYFHRTTAFHGFNRVASGQNTALVTAVAPLSLYAAGLIRKDSYAKQTALLAGVAVLHAEVVTTVLKELDHRLRPAAVPANGNYSDTWFEGRISGIRGSGSFPSGHASAAFAVATVMARRYGGRHRWVPWVAYGAAGAVGFSRLTLSAHFPSDVFMGAALGYSISRYVVLRP